MAYEKLYTAKQAVEAVLKKTEELLTKSEFFKAEKLKKAGPVGQTLGAAIGFPGAATTAPSGPPPTTAVAKGETKHDRCVEHVEANSPSVKNAHAVCVAEGVKPSNWKKSEELAKGETENSKKENAKPSQHGAKDADQHAEGKGPKGEIHPKEKEQAPSDDTRSQAAPEKNPKEQAEGNNELAGTTPTQVGQDGKNKPGFDEMKGHLKLAKFIGHMESKRKAKSGALNG